MSNLLRETLRLINSMVFFIRSLILYLFFTSSKKNAALEPSLISRTLWHELNATRVRKTQPILSVVVPEVNLGNPSHVGNKTCK